MQGDVSFTFLDRIEEVELNIVDGLSLIHISEPTRH